MTNPSRTSSRWTASTVPTTRGSAGGRNPTWGISSSAASSCRGPVVLRERVALGVVALAADLLVDLVAQLAEALQRAVEPHSSASLTIRSTATQAITFECTKCCRGPRTSQSRRRAAASALRAIDRPGTARSIRCGQRRHPELAGAVASRRQLAVDVQLQLAGGGVADAHRARALVAGQPVGSSYSSSRRSPPRPYMICRSSGSPATARSTQSRQLAASST